MNEIPISTGHTPIAIENITDDLLTGWKHIVIPSRQRKLTDEQLIDMYAGRPNQLFTLLTKLVGESYTKDSTILEVGCSTGYYYEILNYLLHKNISYTGVDYSRAMIRAARRFYPKAKFVKADGANLPFKNGEFSTVILGSILLHNANYAEHIKEASRVASKRIIIHRTPLCKKNSTQYMKKQAYGIDVLEIRFNEQELLDLFEKEGWELIRTIEYVSNSDKDEYEASHLLRKKFYRLKGWKDEERGGVLYPLEFKELSFQPQRAFWVFDVFTDSSRGRHAHTKCKQFYICIKGTILIKCIDGRTGIKSNIILCEGEGVFIDTMIWTEEVFVNNAILLVLASEPYDENDYIYDIEKLKELCEEDE